MREFKRQSEVRRNGQDLETRGMEIEMRLGLGKKLMRDKKKLNDDGNRDGRIGEKTLEGREEALERI